jgi:ribosomal protein S11
MSKAEQEIIEEKIKEEKKDESETTSPVKKDSARKEKELEAILNIYTSFNNTLAHVTDMSGRTIAKVSGGQVTKHGRLKANPTIAI